MPVLARTRSLRASAPEMAVGSRTTSAGRPFTRGRSAVTPGAGHRRCCTHPGSNGALADEEDPVPTDGIRATQGGPDASRGYRQAPSEEILVRSKTGAHGASVRDGNHQPDGPPQLRCQTLTLELRCPQLSLDVDQGPLDLDQKHLVVRVEHDVCRAEVTAAHRHLQARRPTGMCTAHDCLREPELSGVSKAHRCIGIQAPTQFGATGSR